MRFFGWPDLERMPDEFVCVKRTPFDPGEFRLVGDVLVHHLQAYRQSFNAATGSIWLSFGAADVEGLAMYDRPFWQKRRTFRIRLEGTGARALDKVTLALQKSGEDKDLAAVPLQLEADRSLSGELTIDPFPAQPPDRAPELRFVLRRGGREISASSVSFRPRD
jgi:hypothetical protein